MRTLICANDSCIVEQLQTCINDFYTRHPLKSWECVCFSTGDELLADKGRKDIVFLDLEMPGVDVSYVEKIIKKYPRSIIFVISSCWEYLDEAMQFGIFRYLMKPIDKYRLYRGLEYALTRYSAMAPEIAVETKQGVYRLPSSSILAVESCGRNAIIHTATQTYKSVHNMQYWIDKLPSKFFVQTHRSFLVNLSHVSNFNHTMIQFYNSPFQAYLSRRNYKEFKDAYLMYLEKNSFPDTSRQNHTTSESKPLC